MKSQKALRNAFLVALYRCSQGDLSRNLCAGDVCKQMGNDEQVLEEIVPQLVELGWMKMTPGQSDPFWVFKITMKGIEEAEKMEGSFGRWAAEHPAQYMALNSIVTSVFTLVVGAALLALFGLK